MRILGIDPALRVTGIGIIDCSRKQCCLVTSGVIRTSEKHSIPRRLLTIYEETLRLMRTYQPDAVVLEKLFVHAQHPATAFVLGQARGSICLACAQANKPLVEYAATQVKKAVIGSGQASKAQIQRMVVSLLGLPAVPRYNDVTDALALAITFHYQSRKTV
ncbi:MAG TPA: crossover junction endodeoxyribonuclease RuvC [Candidatus Omnitrophota bacterium]|nr:crossover junction endodeoxyribonuclease RuvC [Candidatus Omnitrophota bacterium]HRZ15072.1 crossover junction endodeoxyribonuclease RuvC [Candidatus Omnitrophota bacterium]